MKASEAARPPIQPHEITASVEHLICPYHHGPITSRGWMSAQDEGRVFYCPIGKQLYRFNSKGAGGINAPLHYNHERPV